jgi:hypothetical protein
MSGLFVLPLYLFALLGPLRASLSVKQELLTLREFSSFCISLFPASLVLPIDYSRVDTSFPCV